MWNKYLLVTLAVGLPAFALSLPLWPARPGVDPTPLQGALFFGIFAAEGLLFGFGVAFMIFGGRTVRHLARAVGAPAWPVFVSIAWTLLSWWPHDGFHRASGVGDLDATLRIDYAFHLTLIVAAVFIAHFFLATLRATSHGQVARVSR
jgi:hypothetical protein